jgi:phenylacetyl-CoA:acceptor oxidoreductase 26-kDa subunit
MIYGPNPWQQAHWDWRAAANFMGGGLAAAVLVLAGLGLVGLGLLCVWLEIGRPWRAINVFINWRHSWMSRESLVAVIVFASGLGLLAGVPACAAPLALAALVFAYCQARIVQAAKGIPAWREPLTVPLLLATALAEGAGLFWVAASWQLHAAPTLTVVFGVLVLVRWLLWRAWRRCIAGASTPALAAIDRAGSALQWLGGAAPLVAIVLAAGGIVPGAWAAALLSLAGLAVAATGAFFKFTFVTRGAFNQGFALARLPVRGVPR